MYYPFSKVCESERSTEAIAKEFAESLSGGEVIVLNGNLGAGKTFFIKHVCLQLGITNVVSPTFAIVNEHDGKFHINHFDFYRINKIQELYDIGFDDYLNDSKAVTFIEWGNLFPEILPEARIEIKIEFDKENIRTFHFRKYE